jgi:hypothetical protein
VILVLKSLGACHCAGSIPAPGINNFKGLVPLEAGPALFVAVIPMAQGCPGKTTNGSGKPEHLRREIKIVYIIR